MKTQVFSLESLLVVIAISSLLATLFYLQYALVHINYGEGSFLVSFVHNVSILEAIAADPVILHEIYLYDIGIINSTQLYRNISKFGFIGVYQYINNSFVALTPIPANHLAEEFLLIGNLSLRNVTNRSLGLYIGLAGFSFSYKAAKCLVSYSNGSRAPFLFVYNNTPTNYCTVYSVQNTPPLPFVVKGYNLTGFYLGETEYIVAVPTIITIG
jgi:hypothetical protein